MKINNKLLVLVLVFSIILICSLNTLGAEKASYWIFFTCIK